MTRIRVLLALAALILAAGTVALWSRTAPTRVHFDDVPLLRYAGSRFADPRLLPAPASGRP